MRIVVDTNVLVSGLLNADGPPGMVVNRVLSRAVIALYDSRMLAEYREVLARPRLRIPAPGVRDRSIASRKARWSGAAATR